MKLNSWRLDEASLIIQKLNFEEMQLNHAAEELESFAQREMKIFDKTIELHPIVPQFLKNITLRKQIIDKRRQEIERERSEIWEKLQEIYSKKKKLEQVIHKIDAEDQRKQSAAEQKIMDELALRQNRLRD
ncbi:MAG: hypothetical protein BGO28_06400 [Alphaproteobacteria bacterium 43-37]|nr:MAG: hypothetical protein BGO28_06400 [Alphaproteobacteria bacterium 43-37]